MAATAIGMYSWGLSRDQLGYRDYKITTYVKTDDPTYGPGTVMGASGLPAIGSTWGYGSETDAYVWCQPEMTIESLTPGEPGIYWKVDQHFSNKPLGHSRARCQTTTIQDPLAEPPKISGSFSRYTEENVSTDKDGKQITSSSLEPIQGLSKDRNRPSVNIELNVSSLGLSTFSQMVDTVNDATLWGMAARHVKLSNVSWERKMYGTCTFYYTQKFEFEVRYDSFDIVDVADAGFMVLRGSWINHKWVPVPGLDKTKKENYIQFRDENTHAFATQQPLDGNGNPNFDPTTAHLVPAIKLYSESNFLTLGIPTSL